MMTVIRLGGTRPASLMKLHKGQNCVISNWSHGGRIQERKTGEETRMGDARL